MNSTPIPVRILPARVDVVCDGSPAARGAQCGAACRDLLRDSVNAVFELEAFRRMRPWWLPLRGFGWLADRRALRTLQRTLEQQLPGHWQRLTALADAAGIPLARVALLNALEPVLSNLRGNVSSGTEAACSAVGIAATRSGTGGTIVAHNFDYLPLVQRFYIIRDERAAPGRLRSLQFSIAPLSGAVDGLNEAGLAITYNYGYAVDVSPPAPTISMRISDALAECRTVPEAADYLTRQSRWGAALLLLGDATGQVASLELTGTRHALRAANSDGWVSHSNAFCQPVTRQVEVSRDAVHGPRAPAALRGRRVHLSAECRDARLQELLGGPGPIGLEQVHKVMSDHGPNGDASADTICMHSDYWHTTAAIQLLPAERRLRVKFAPACAGDYVEFGL